MMKSVWIIPFIMIILSLAVFAGSGVGESTSGFLTSRPPESPILRNPQDGIMGVPNTIIVNWYPLLHTQSFNLQIANTSDFSQPILNLNNLADTSFTVIGLEDNTRYYWRISANNVAGSGPFSQVWSFSTEPAASIDTESLIPQYTMLFPPSPNPFNPMTLIRFHLSERADISLDIVNSLGQTVVTLISGEFQSGEYRFRWDGSDRHGRVVPGGIYLCLLKTEKRIFRRKILFMH